jgi:hypothetical protein
MRKYNKTLVLMLAFVAVGMLIDINRYVAPNHNPGVQPAWAVATPTPTPTATATATATATPTATPTPLVTLPKLPRAGEVGWVDSAGGRHIISTNCPGSVTYRTYDPYGRDTCDDLTTGGYYRFLATTHVLTCVAKPGGC